jgi:hypothetical protein
MSSYIFNPSDWNNTSNVTDDMISEIEAVLDNRYVDVVGDTVTGYFQANSMGVSNSLNASDIIII